MVIADRDIYKLALHESIPMFDGETPVGTYVMRVPGGWIYTDYTPDNPHSVFVPFNSEFQDKAARTVDE